jgi:hypothetical protein
MEQGDVATSDTGSYVNSPLCAGYPQIVAGDKIEVKGSRITYQGKPAIIAAEIHKGDEVLMLRDANGIPMWAGWRRNQ